MVPKVAELFCEDRFGDAAVRKVTGAKGWDMEDEKQMKEVKRRVMDEEHGRTFYKLIGDESEGTTNRGKDEMFNDEMFNATLDLP